MSVFIIISPARTKQLLATNTPGPVITKQKNVGARTPFSYCHRCLLELTSCSASLIYVFRQNENIFLFQIQIELPSFH